VPCTYDDSHERAQAAEAQRRELKTLKGWVCDLCTQITNVGGSVPDHIREWYAAHEKAEEEKLRTEALAKLSERDKRVLGLTKKK
jgi:DNA-directed RNA polymerase specialized sigma subunit